MTLDLTTLDAHEQPSDELRGIWKAYSKTDHAAFVSHPDIDDLSVPEKAKEFRSAGSIPKEKLLEAFGHLEGPDWKADQDLQDAPIYFHPLLPGLLVLPSLIPPGAQKTLVSRLAHRDLSNPTHQTNLHLHYHVPYIEGDGGACGSEEASGGADRSFFSLAPDADVRFEPKDPAVHKPLSVKQVLERKLSWVTLGGQYDWTNREYPTGAEVMPAFPADIAGCLRALFPETAAQAAIVNFYTPGDTMMMHRDVSEATDKGLVSLSLGCDALFMIAPNDYAHRAPALAAEHGRAPYLLLRLRSGDAIYMAQESRYAWHGVPKVLKGTCPDFLADWPAGEGKYEDWRGWMRNKRINLNVRQMK